MRSSGVNATGIVALLGSVAGVVARKIDESKFSPADIVVRDVAIIGGGASGAYAAVRIKDSGKTVVVVDQSDHLVSAVPQTAHCRCRTAHWFPRAAMSTPTRTI